MVGISASIPRLADNIDIRLGDVIVSQPTGASPGVVQYDIGKLESDGHFKRVGSLAPPPEVLLKGLATLKAKRRLGGPRSFFWLIFASVRSPASSNITRTIPPSDATLQELGQPRACEHCDSGKEIGRPQRRSTDPVVHYGLVASGNSVVKDGVSRDDIVQRLGDKCICFEMEAAGLMDNFPCLVIRGICDYADTHKNDRWQNYSAATAAALAKELLEVIDSDDVEGASTIDEIMEHLREDVSQIRSTTKDMQQDLHFQEVMKWLSPPDPSTNDNKALQQRHGGTGQWFLDSQEYSKWKTTQKSSLWLHGIPGCGKTILSSIVVEDLRDTTPYAKSFLYFYFDFTDTSKSPLRQPNINELRKAFEDMIQQIGEVWIVLDALDEYQTRKVPGDEGLLLWIESILHSPRLNVHFLVISRPEHDIKSALGRFVDDQIVLQSDLVTEDIQALEKCPDPVSLRQTLQSLPRTLDETYERVLNRIPPEFEQNAIRILQFLAFSERPLRIEEAVDVIAVVIGNKPRFDAKNRMPQAEEISIYCSSLVAVVTRDEDGDNRVKELQLAYFSVKEYLLSDRLRQNIFRTFVEAQARASITEICLAVHDLIREFCLDEESPQTSYQLYNPDEPWEEEPERSKTDETVVLYYVACGGIVSAVEEVLKNGADVNTQGGRYGNALQAASGGGHQEIVQMLLNNGADVNAQGGDYGNALQAASFRGHQEIVQMLLINGADVNAQDGYSSNALYAASVGGHQEIVQMLLNNRADINAQGGRYSNALQAASERGYQEIVQMLLNNGAEVDSKDVSGQTPLSWAAEYGHEAVVKMLLDTAKVDIDSEDTSGRTPLSWAAQYGHAAVVKMLLDTGRADINSSDNIGRTPLSWAIIKGHVEVVLLLANAYDADINIRDHNGFSPFMRAVWRSNKEVVDILLQMRRLSHDDYMDRLCFQAFWFMLPHELDQFIADITYDIGDDFFGLKRLFYDSSIL
ncbi:hypothetical protein CKAH01_15750 [Colletotrichum kahawae]|uniref:NACHT domain-containing protein n=1 Tax=Colletotrichum kahawae TaxID=34407 RepID=A0AAD9YI58_COLKA|nr:hypothetical protein CKAH01_15750 [Colletotrichum kahawae]